MDRKQRVIWSDNGTLIDVSKALGDFRRDSLTFVYTQVQDALYVGAELPFNHKYFDIGTANDVASVFSVAIWSGSAWNAAVDVKDETVTAAAATTSLAQSGFISWARDLTTGGWGQQPDSNNITALAGTRIFDLYWCRFTWSVTLKSTTTLKYIGERLSDDEDLFDLYPDLANASLMSAYETGKTSWKDQEFAAADFIVKHLRRNGILFRKEQIMDETLLTEASVHKTAGIIYAGLGNGYRDRVKDCNERFNETVPDKFPEVDRNASGDADMVEKTTSMSWGSR